MIRISELNTLPLREEVSPKKSFVSQDAPEFKVQPPKEAKPFRIEELLEIRGKKRVSILGRILSITQSDETPPTQSNTQQQTPVKGSQRFRGTMIITFLPSISLHGLFMIDIFLTSIS
jgi:hypothetical protein